MKHMLFPRHTSAYLILVFVFGSIACGFERKGGSPSAPTGAETATGYLGTWSSAAAIAVPPATSCTALNWAVTEVSANVVSGTFTASCAGGLQATGSGLATVHTTNADWNATGTATQDGTSCPFTLAGTAALASSKVISLTYAGTVCGVAVSGTENLKK